MKTKSLLLTALFVISALATGFGKEDPAMKKGLAVVSVRGTDVFKIFYQGERAGKVKLNVYNTESELVFSESFVRTERFVRPLNFAGLQAGEYTIELKDRDGKKTQKVTIKQTVKKVPALLVAIE
jgi:hypothetical protein